MRIFRIMQFEMSKFRTIEIFLDLNSAKYRQMNIFSAVYSKGSYGGICQKR